MRLYCDIEIYNQTIVIKYKTNNCYIYVHTTLNIK